MYTHINNLTLYTSCVWSFQAENLLFTFLKLISIYEIYYKQLASYPPGLENFEVL